MLNAGTLKAQIEPSGINLKEKKGDTGGYSARNRLKSVSSVESEGRIPHKPR